MGDSLGLNGHWLSGRIYDQRVRDLGKCLGKRSYSYPDAVNAVLRYTRRVALTFGEFNCYYCSVHASWHIGHRGKRDALVKVFDRAILRGEHADIDDGDWSPARRQTGL